MQAFCSHLLLTGANGFVGKAVASALLASGWPVVAAVRRLLEPIQQHGGHLRWQAVASINSPTDWHSALQGVGVVVHLAARAHVMHDKLDDPLAEYRRVNVQGTDNLARQAKTANQVFLVSDGDDVSTTELMRRVAHAFRVPDRLLGSLQVDASKAHDLLGWSPPVSMQAQLRKMAHGG